MPDRDESRRGPLIVDVGTESGDSMHVTPVEKRHHLTTFGRFKPPEGSPKQREYCIKPVWCERRESSVDHVEQIGIVEQHGARPGE